MILKGCRLVLKAIFNCSLYAQNTMVAGVLNLEL
jgi:hypothetical protein